MNLKRVVCSSALAAGVGVAGLLGVGLGVAGADPGQPCGAPNAPSCQGPGPGQGGPAPAAPNNWQNRGIDQGRQDHQPFLFNGQQVQPMPAGNGSGWGFWFFNQWIPL